MNWKQPIPTECLKMDTISRLVYMEICIRLQQQDMDFPEVIISGNQRHFVKLSRGQCLFNVNQFCRESGISRKKVDETLRQLSSDIVPYLFNIEKKAFGTLITVNDPETFFSFATETKRSGNSQATDRQLTGKSIKGKNEERRMKNEEEREIKTPTPSLENQDLKSEVIKEIQNLEPTFGVNYSAATEIVNFLMQIPDRNQYIAYLAAKNSAFFLDVKRVTEWEYAKYKQGNQNTQAGTKSNPDVPYYDPNFPIDKYVPENNSVPELAPHILERIQREMAQYREPVNAEKYVSYN